MISEINRQVSRVRLQPTTMAERLRDLLLQMMAYEPVYYSHVREVFVAAPIGYPGPRRRLGRCVDGLPRRQHHIGADVCRVYPIGHGRGHTVRSYWGETAIAETAIAAVNNPKTA